MTYPGKLRKPTVFDIVYLIEHMREADKREIKAFSGRTPEESFNATINLYETSTVWEMGGKVVCIFGTAPSGVPDEWLIWMLATDEFDKNSKIFRKYCREIFGKMIEGKKYLYNHVHAEHKSAVRWLKWLGCKLYDAEPIGINGELFHKFEVMGCVNRPQ